MILKLRYLSDKLMFKTIATFSIGNTKSTPNNFCFLLNAPKIHLTNQIRKQYMTSQKSLLFITKINLFE